MSISGAYPAIKSVGSLPSAYSTGGGANVLLADYTQSITGLEVDFTDQSQGGGNTIISHFWDFDDTFTSELQNPTHTFAAPGTYYVSLTVIDVIGNTNATSRPIVVTGANVPPTASFTYEDTGLEVAFTDTSTDPDGTVDAWSWDFGD